MEESAFGIDTSYDSKASYSGKAARKWRRSLKKSDLNLYRCSSFSIPLEQSPNANRRDPVRVSTAEGARAKNKCASNRRPLTSTPNPRRRRYNRNLCPRSKGQNLTDLLQSVINIKSKRSTGQTETAWDKKRSIESAVTQCNTLPPRVSVTSVSSSLSRSAVKTVPSTAALAELRECKETIEQLQTKVDKLEFINKYQENRIKELECNRVRLEEQVDKLQTINQNLMRLVNHSNDAVTIDPIFVPSNEPASCTEEAWNEDSEERRVAKLQNVCDKYNEVCVKNMQVEMEKLMRERDELAIQVERATACETETKLENELMKKFVQHQRSKSKELRRAEGGMCESRRLSLLDDTMSVKSFNDKTFPGDTSARNSKVMTRRTSVTKLKTQADVKRWYKAYQLMERISRCTNYKDVLSVAVRSISQIIQCDRWTIMLQDEGMTKYVLDEEFGNLYKDKVFYIRKWYAVLSDKRSTYSELQFKKTSHLKGGRKSHKLMFKGIPDPKTRELYGGFQIEKLKSGNMYTGVYTGFTELDDGLMSLLTEFIGVKLCQITETLLSRHKDQRLFDTINTINTLFECRTYMFLIVSMRDLVPKMIGYEYVGLYFYDPLGNELCTCLKSDYVAGIKTLIRYPLGIGITGSVFNDQKPVISLKGKKEKNFHEIDSTGAYADIRNFVFMPMHGLNNSKLGVLQLFNKVTGEPKEDQLEGLKPYERLVGMLMQNALELNTSMDVVIQLKNVLCSLDEKTSINVVSEMGRNVDMAKVQNKLRKLRDIVDTRLEKRAAKSPTKKC